MALVHLPSAEDLYHALDGEVEACRELVALTQRERLALQADNLDDLAAATQHKEALARSLARWEQVRERIVRRLLEELRLPAGASLSEIIAQTDGAIAHKLVTLRQELAGLMEQLLTLNHGNRLLIQAELARVEATFEYLARVAAPPDGHYTANGNRRSPAAAGQALNWQV
jgi:flagellar biosynthesis/type III secretory pathway chaperone